MWIRIQFYADTDPDLQLNADLDPGFPEITGTGMQDNRREVLLKWQYRTLTEESRGSE